MGGSFFGENGTWDMVNVDHCTLNWIQLAKSKIVWEWLHFTFWLVLLFKIWNCTEYRVLIEKYPENLITEDEWGALPLLYMQCGGVHQMRLYNYWLRVIKQSILNMNSIGPKWWEHWEGQMPKRASFRCCLIWCKIRFLIKLSIGTGYVRRSSVQTERDLFELEYSPSTETFRFMVKCSISTRVGMVGLRLLRDDISNDIDNMRIWGYRMCRVRYYRRIPRALLPSLLFKTNLLIMKLSITNWWRPPQGLVGIVEEQNDWSLPGGEKAHHSKRRKVGESQILENNAVSVVELILLSSIRCHIYCQHSCLNLKYQSPSTARWRQW